MMNGRKGPVGCSGLFCGDHALRWLDDSASADARGAHVDVGRCLTDHGPHSLDVGIPTALGTTMGVGHVHPEARVLPTDFTDGCHDDAFSGRGFTTGQLATLASIVMVPCEIDLPTPVPSSGAPQR